MPTFEFERSVSQPGHLVLQVLGRVDLHQSFLPGCAASTVQHCEKSDDDTWRGSVKYVLEVKKYGISEQADVAFSVDEKRQKLRFVAQSEDDDNSPAEVVYTIVDSGSDASVVRVRIHYAKPIKRFF